LRTESNAAVLQQVAEVVEHGPLVLSADPAEVAQEATAVGHHLGEPDLLQTEGGNTEPRVSYIIYIISSLPVAHLLELRCPNPYLLLKHTVQYHVQQQVYE